MDDRDFSQYGHFRREHYLTFNEYVRKVLADQPARSEEFKQLVELYGFEKIEKVMGEKE